MSLSTTSGDVFSACVLTKNIELPVSQLGKNIRELLTNKLVGMVEGKCGDKGYIKTNSVRVKTYSSGALKSSFAQFVVVYECLIFTSATNMILECKVIENTNSAGVRAFSNTESPTPFVAYLLKDHNYNNDRFNQLVSGDIINVKVKCATFEINDPMVSLVGELV